MGDTEGGGGAEYKAYTEYSIGFLTRGCFRHCPFCVNRRYNEVVAHSPLEEFYEPSRRKICLLDDNFLGYEGWEQLLEQLNRTGKSYHFKQGLDVRLLDERKARKLFSSRYDGKYLFAFDDWAEAGVIEERLRLIRRVTRKGVRFYVLCGYDRRGIYDDRFWVQDLKELVLRLALLKRYEALPYVMRFERYRESPYRTLYIEIASWSNQPAFFQKVRLTEFIMKHRVKCSDIITLAKEMECLMDGNRQGSSGK